MGNAKKNNLALPIAAVVIVILAAIVVAMSLSGGEQNTNPNGNSNPFPQVTPPSTAQVGGSGGAGQTTPPGTQGTVVTLITPVATPAFKHGTLTLSPVDSNQGNGVTSNMLFLNPSYARDTNGNAMFDSNGAKTSSGIFSVLNTVGYVDFQIGAFGINSLSGYRSNAVKTNTVSSGAWSQTLDGYTGDYLLAYTYVPSGNTYKRPAIGDNMSSARLIYMKDFNDPNNIWIASPTPQTQWGLDMYGNYSFVNSAGTTVANYTIGDGGTAATRQQIPFYINATNNGDNADDLGVFLAAPKNITTKFGGIVLIPRSVSGDPGPTSVQWNNLYDPSSQGVGVAASLLSGNVTTFNDNLFYLGTIPSNWVIKKTANDRNQITGTITTDTYGSKVIGKLFLVHRVHALGVNNGAFITPTSMAIQFSSGSSTGNDIAP